MIKTPTVVLLLLTSAVVQGQELPELLQPVDAYESQRLIEYNGSSLQDQLYFAKRFRIVITDTKLLLADETFAITPFDDVAPIRLTKEVVYRYDDSVAWNALAPTELSLALQAAGLKMTVPIIMTGWDTDDLGNASDSSINRFEFNNGTRALQPGVLPMTGPELMARRQELLRLKKHSFYAVTTTIQMPNGTKYFLVPLEYTPSRWLISA